MSKKFTFFMGVMVAALIVAGVGFSFLKKVPLENSSIKDETKTMFIPVNSPGDAFSRDEKLIWSDPVKTEYRDYFEIKETKPVGKILKGYEISATSTGGNANALESEGVVNAWNQDKFLQMGWKEDLSTEADGPTSHIWGYLKGNSHVIFSSNLEYSSYTPHDNEPDEGVCPCTYTISIFSDDVNMLNMIKNTPINNPPKNN